MKCVMLKAKVADELRCIMQWSKLFLLPMYSGQQLVVTEGHQAKGLKTFVITIHVFSQAYENFYYCIQEVTGVKFGQLTNNTAIFNWFSQPLKASAQSSLSNSMLMIIWCTHSTLHKTLALKTAVLRFKYWLKIWHTWHNYSCI